MAADAWVVYPRAKEMMGTGDIGELDAGTVKCILCLSTSNAASAAATIEKYADITNEVATANGYTQGGVTVAGTVSESSGTVTFDVADPSWTASGGSIVARFAVLYNDTPTTPIADPLIAYCLLDNTPDDVTQADGGTLTVTIHSSGVFTLA